MEVISGPADVNETGYNEEPAKYMAAPAKGFWKSIRRAFGMNSKGIADLAIVGLVALAGVVVWAVASGLKGMVDQVVS